MKRTLTVFVMIIAALSTAQGAVTYSGSLSVDHGLEARRDWDRSSTTLSWIVDDTTAPGLWHYEYSLSVRRKDIDYLIVETPNTLTEANLFDLNSNPASWIKNVESGTYSDPPANLTGLKIDADYGLKVVTFGFDSDYAPGWGDFYATDGHHNTLYNNGLGSNNPLDGPANGSINNHILVPNTPLSTSTPVPAPGAAILACLGIGLARRIRRKRT
jgi:hypothetical protein